MMNKATFPEGWKIKKMPDVVKWGSGGTPKATEKSFYDGGTIPWLIIGDLNDGIITSSASKITPLGLENSNAKMIPPGTLLIAMYGSIGKLGITGMECCTNQAIAFAKELYGVSVKYMFYFLSMKKSYLISKGKGGTQKNISLTVLNAQDVIVPPLPEQERIVSRIEELFSQLDAAVAELQAVKEKLNIYRQAVLKEAFDGSLTTQWREDNPQYSFLNIWTEICDYNRQLGRSQKYVLQEEIELPKLPKSWKWIHIGDISTGPEYGTAKKSLKKGKVPVIRMGNMQNGVIVWDDLVFSNDEEEISKYHLNKGDVLFNRTNSPELVGKTAIFNGERDAIFAGYLIRINHHRCIDSNYLTLYMNSFISRKYSNKVKTDGVNQSNISGTTVCSYPFPLSSMEEQEQLVFQLENRLVLYDKIASEVAKLLQKIESLRQSILKQAFEGNL